MEDASQHVFSLPNDTAHKELTSCKICFKLHFTNIAFTNSNIFTSSGQNALTAVHSDTGRRENRICIYFIAWHLSVKLAEFYYPRQD